MRTIKFRAWDLDNQEMYYQSETKFSEGSYDDCEDARCIEWSEETLQFVAECKSCRDSIPMYEFDYREIIGNIYQNPELLA